MRLLLATTGLRRGELAGIVDSSLDLSEGRLVVEWQLVPELIVGDDGGLIPVHKPVMKSSASSRSVDLDGHTVTALRKWLGQRATWAEEHRWEPSDSIEACERGHGRTSHGRFLFCWPDGRHLHPVWMTREFTRMCRDADVQRSACTTSATRTLP